VYIFTGPGLVACRRRPLSSNYKGFPISRKCFEVLSFHVLLSGWFIVCLPVLVEKMVDCETTTGHVGQIARTLMKDARRGLNR